MQVIHALAPLALALPAFPQASQHALRFHGTGTSQQDRVRIQIDDDAAGPDASAPCDVGAGSFTLECWLRGELADNATGNWGGDVQRLGVDWNRGNVLFDRDIWGGSERKFGASVAGGFVRFGVSRGDTGGGVDVTIEGDVPVLDGEWHHVALVRDVGTGGTRIYVDGLLDFASAPKLSTADLSYPDDGVSGQFDPWGPYIVLAAEKHDAGPSYPSFAGFLDEVRVWSHARTQAQILESYERVLPAGTNGLVASWRFEEGNGTDAFDSSGASSPPGLVIAGLPGNGEWVSFASDPRNTAPVSDSELPFGFSHTTLVGDLDEPTVLEHLPDGRLLIGERDGTILLVEGQSLAGTVIEIPVDASVGRALVGLAADPTFASNGHFYVYWTTMEPRNRVSRFSLVGESADPASEFVVWENPELAADYHHGGCLAFGRDGKLYITTGDQYDSYASQDLGSEHGKILRLNPDGTVPDDNPFVDTTGASPRVFAYGLRNPFRITFDLLAGRLYIGDVGGNASDAWEEVNTGPAGANFGWPNQEGPDCSGGGCAQFRFPIWTYRHDDAAFALDQPQGSVTLGPIYRGMRFPPPYRGNLFVGDYSNRWIRRLVRDANGAILGAPIFYAKPDAGTIVDMEVGPDGALYTITVGVPWSGNPDEGALHRIGYSGGNVPPVAVAGAEPREGLPPLKVHFSSDGTLDPDHGPEDLEYEWDLDDGTVETLADPLHTFAQVGLYTVRLKVDDGADTASADPIKILVGNAPTAKILAPLEGTQYRAGDTIDFTGTGFDVEDGNLAASAFTWQVVLVHAGHAHPFYGPVTGITSGSFQIPSSGHEPENTHYEILLEVVDADDLPGSATRPISPIASTLVFDSLPSGIPFQIDGEVQDTPRVYASLEGYVHELQAYGHYVLDDASWIFCGWSIGRAPHQSYTAPPGGAVITAIYAPLDAELVTTTVPADNRNAEWYEPVGQSYSNANDSFGLCAGRDWVGVHQFGFEFPTDVPLGALVLSATIEFVPTADQSGDPNLYVWGYDVADAPRFEAGSGTPLLEHAPLTDAYLAWSPPPFTMGVPASSPDLSAIVQEIVDRPDWVPGKRLGIVFDGRLSLSDAWRCVRNHASGEAPALRVLYALPGAPCPGVTRGR